MIDEGYIKFHANWTNRQTLNQADIDELNVCRQQMYELGVIGAYENGIGFGNISKRVGDSSQFYISGSKTGNITTLHANHYAKVTAVDISNNALSCEGASIASSESMSHAVIYETCDWVNAVVHIHHYDLWKKILHKVPTTAPNVPYGSPEMAYSIIDLLNNTDAQEQKIFAMEGHEEGLFMFGEYLEEAAEVVKKWLDKLKKNRF